MVRIFFMEVVTHRFSYCVLFSCNSYFIFSFYALYRILSQIGSPTKHIHHTVYCNECCSFGFANNILHQSCKIKEQTSQRKIFRESMILDMDKRDSLVLIGILVGTGIPVILMMLVANGKISFPSP